MQIRRGRRQRSRRAALLVSGMLMFAGVAPALDQEPAWPAAAAETQQSVTGQIQALRKEFGQEARQAMAAYQAARGKPSQERIKIYQEKLPKPLPFAQKAMALARQNPKDPAAVDALTFVLELTGRGGSPEQTNLQREAIQQLSRDQLDNRKLCDVFPIFRYPSSEAGENLMRLAAEKSKNRDVRGLATYWLAQALKTSSEWTGDERKLAEAKKLYQQVVAEYADVAGPRGTLGERAKSNLFEIENLAVGQPAPQIEGKDADGKPMKLSDYRGKVVVLDFWGDW